MSNKVYEVLTSKIIESLEDGHIPWEKPWNGVNNSPKNHVSGKDYRGFNAMLTAHISMIEGYKTNNFVTYKQAKDLGGEVKKGEKGIPIMFWKFLEDEDGEETIPLLRYYTVFNLDQCDGIEIPELPEMETNKLETKTKIDLKVMEYLIDGPEVKEVEGDRAYYMGAKDLVVIPELQQFKGIEEYYATLFHELGHSTGHQNRLNRPELVKTSYFGNTEYAKEELVAELTACFILSHFGLVDRTIKNHKAYITGWLKALKSNPKWIVEASTKAQKACEYILGIDNNKGD